MKRNRNIFPRFTQPQHLVPPHGAREVNRCPLFLLSRHLTRSESVTRRAKTGSRLPADALYIRDLRLLSVVSMQFKSAFSMKSD